MSSERDGLIDDDKRLVLKGKTDPSVAPIVEKALEKCWKSITVQGHIELCRATWFEARMAGLEVNGYRPSREDQELLGRMEEQRQKSKRSEMALGALEVVDDYNRRVVPHLQKRFEQLRRQRSKLGVTTTDIDRAYGINMPIGYAREVDDKFDRAKGALLRAIDERDFFLSLGRQRVAVKFSFEDGIARFVVRGEKSLFENRYGHEISRRYSQ